jgi:hypothetical protein
MKKEFRYNFPFFVQCSVSNTYICEIKNSELLVIWKYQETI